MVREGYKQTEVGVIPEDWSVHSIGSIASVSSGGTPSRSIKAYWGGEIPWITTTQIDFNTIVEADQFVTEKGLQSSAAKMYPPKTLLMAMYGQGKTRGKVAKLGMEASTNQACAAIVLKDNKKLDFIFYYLSGQYDEIRALSNIGNQENLNGFLIQSIKVPLPPTEAEQKNIAEALSDVNGLIEGLEKLIAKKRDIKTATMQQLLTGKTRLPGFGEGRGYKQTELGDIPEDWQSKCIGDVVNFSGGSQPPRSTFVFRPQKGYLRLIQIRDYKSDKDATYIPEELAKKKCTKDDVMIGRYGPPIFQILRGIVGAYNVALIKAIPSEDIRNDYLYYILKGERLFTLMESLSQRSSGQTGVELAALKDYPLPLPSVREQQAIAGVLSDMDKVIEVLQSRLDKIKGIKQGMMQELLTGKTRLV